MGSFLNWYSLSIKGCSLVVTAVASPGIAPFSPTTSLIKNCITRGITSVALRPRNPTLLFAPSRGALPAAEQRMPMLRPPPFLLELRSLPLFFRFFPLSNFDSF